MSESIYVPILAFGGLTLLLILSLPLAGIQKTLLTLCAWTLRLVILATLAGAAYLWFRPQEAPVELAEAVGGFPALAGIMPAPGTQYFGVCLGSLIVVALLPLLAVLDVTGKVAGWRREPLRPVISPAAATEEPMSAPTTPLRRVDRRTASAALAEARRPIVKQPV